MVLEQGGELTGTGDSRLFQLLGYPMKVNQLDKTTAAVIKSYTVAGLDASPLSYAFSFWGGDFYIYVAPGSNTTLHSSVIHYSPSTNTVDLSYVADVGFIISGAGRHHLRAGPPPQ